MDLHLLMAWLPVVFMVHDFEEIVMFEPWLRKNRADVSRRYPFIGRLLARSHAGLSTSAYAVAVLHEFVIIAGLTVFALWSGQGGLWFGAFAAFGLHLLVHVAQWLIYGRYVPFIVTTLLALPYCGYTAVRYLAATSLTSGELLAWTAVGVSVTLLSFPSAFALAGRFERWKNTSYLAE